MLENYRGITSNEIAGNAIMAYSLIAFGDEDGTPVQADGTRVLYGVATEVDALAGERVDVVLSGIAPVKLGGAVDRGVRVKSDAAGLGVAAAATDDNIGTALKTGAAGDIIPVLLRA